VLFVTLFIVISHLILSLFFAVYCPNVSCDQEVLINWVYAVEFIPDLTIEEKTQAVTIMELKLVPELLECNQQAALPGKRFVRHRHLLEDGIAGLNYMPLDEKNEDMACFFSSNSTNSTSGGVCETYSGKMEMCLQKDTIVDVAVKNMLYKIRDVMQRDTFPAIDEIARVWYLEPNLDEVDAIAGGGIVPIAKAPVDDSFSTGTMIAFAALGVFAFAAIVLGAFRMRRNETDVVTAFDQSTATGSGMTNANDPYGVKKLSAILPYAYKLDDSDMSAIPEGDDDTDSRYNCSVIISDGGFTSDGESHVGDPSFPTNFDPVLGASESEEDDMNVDRNMRFDAQNLPQSEQEYSDHRKKSLVVPSQVGLGVRHSTVDVHQCTSANCKICNYKPKDVEFIHRTPNSPDISMGKFFPDEHEEEC
jgi:hypothetical protein